MAGTRKPLLTRVTRVTPAVLLLALIFGAVLAVREFRRIWTPQKRTFAQVAETTRLRFPPTTELVGAQGIQAPYDFIMAKLRLPREDLKEFLANADLELTQSAEAKDRALMGLPLPGFNRPGWWGDPTTASDVLAGSTSFMLDPDNQYSACTSLDVLVDRDDPEYAVLYIGSMTDY